MKEAFRGISFSTALLFALIVPVRAQNTAPATTPNDAWPLVITVTPDSTTVHPGDTIKLDVAIKNVSQTEQKIEMPNIIWAAATDVPQVTIPGWPRGGGLGPAVTFRSVAIAPGQSYEHTWNANVLPTAEAGEVTLRVGVPLHRTVSDKTWSAPLKLKVAAKEPAVAVANPLYPAWKGQEGKTVTFNRAESISGGAPVPGGGARATSSKPVQFTLSEFSAEQATIKVTTDPTLPAETLVVPARLMPDDPTLPKSAGAEQLKVGDKTYACKKYTYYTSSKAELGREPQGLRGRVTVWVADGVPGGIVQRTISLTIRVTYSITDTLALKQ